MASHRIFWNLLLLLALPFPFGNLQAESILLPLPSEKILSLYDKPRSELNESELWKIKMHGLRLAPLHPSVWTGLKREKTQNRRLVPIKRYFLRDSEDPDFNLKTLTVSFRFKPESQSYMEKLPSQKDPVFEIGFGGTFKETSLVEDPTEDRFFVVRLSAFSSILSGIYLREKEKFQLLQTTPQLQVGTDYELKMSFDDNRMRVMLNKEKYAELSRPDIDKGLVSLQTSWHPIFVQELLVLGESSSEKRLLQLSGLVDEAAKG